MSIYAEVNTCLRRPGYLIRMAEKRRKPGSPKGQSKPRKRSLDPLFPDRLDKAMGTVTVPQLARLAHCTRAVLLNYLSGKNKTIDALLLFEIADRLGISARWLLTGLGPDAPVERSKLETIRLILSEAAPPTIN